MIVAGLLFLNIIVISILLIVLWRANKNVNEATHNFETYQAQVEARVKKERQAAINSSRIVVKGQIAEQMFPMINKLVGNYEMGDMIFIGKLFDYIIVDGYNDAKDNDGDIKEVVILDVKTGNAKLSSHQEKLKKAIDEKRVVWKTIRIDDSGNLIEDNQQEKVENE